MCYLDTLLTHYSVLVNQNAVNDTVVDGVAIALPNLFVGPRIVVHGLDGILVPGELGLDASVRDSDDEFHRELSPPAPIEPDFLPPVMSPVSFESPTSFEPPMSFESPVSFASPAESPKLPPKTEPEPVVSRRSSLSPRRTESRSKVSKRKNRGKVARSKGRRRRGRNGHDRHGRFSKFIDHHRSDF